MFKIGDKVKFKDHVENREFPIGILFTVVKMRNGCLYLDKYPQNDPGGFGYFERRFEKVDPVCWPPKTSKPSRYKAMGVQYV